MAEALIDVPNWVDEPDLGPPRANDNGQQQHAWVVPTE
jgi:hypothetical protein